jgi:16S rRNA (uracil1498-N3)-methyltransferase
MATHTIYLPELKSKASTTGSGGAARVVVEGEEAHHAARVKRLEVGDAVRLCDGKGGVADGKLVDIRKEKRSGEWVVEVEAPEVRQVERPRPLVRVYSAVPKGDGLGQMIDGLSQVGAASWAPLVSRRSVVEPREGKLKRLERVAEEALKQSGREWLLEIGEGVELGMLLGSGAKLVVADGTGEAYAGDGDAGEVSLLIGPEGGWDDRELAAMREGGVRVANFGPHVMRIEVAAVVCAARVWSGGR